MAMVSAVVLCADQLERKYSKGRKMRNRMERTIAHAIERPFLTGWTPRVCVLETIRDLQFDGEDCDDRYGSDMEGWEIGRCLSFGGAVRDN